MSSLHAYSQYILHAVDVEIVPFAFLLCYVTLNTYLQKNLPITSPRDKQMHFRYDKAYSIGQRRPSEVPRMREVSVMGAFFRIQGDAL